MDLDDLISRYIDGELDSQAEAELHHRLSISPEARSALRSHTALREASRDTRILDTPSPALHAALFNRLQQDEGMARAAAAAVVPAEALAPIRREAVPSEMHNPGRRVRRRRTALWFALPMVIIATVLASEFLLVDGDETRRLTNAVQQVRPSQSSPSIASSPSTPASPPSTSSSETGMAANTEAKELASAPRGVSSMPRETLSSQSSSRMDVDDVASGSEGPTATALTPPPSDALASRSAERRAARNNRVPVDVSLETIGSESLMNRPDGGTPIAAARSVDSQRDNERSPLRILSNTQGRPDTVSVVLNEPTRMAQVEGSRSSMAQGLVSPDQNLEGGRVFSMAPSAPVAKSRNYFDSDFAANSNQLQAPSVSAMQRSVNLADSALPSLVRKDTLRRAAKAAPKKAQFRSRRASRR